MKITEYPREERLYKDMGFIEIYFSFRPDFTLSKRNKFGILYTLDDAQMPPNSRGFGMHPHRDMEVITLFLEGEGHHEDNHGNVGVTHAKAIQLISAGTGIMHEEYNFSKDKTFKAIQMFTRPREKGIAPNYQKWELSSEDYEGRLCELLSPTGRNKSLKIANDSFLNYGILESGSEVTYQLNDAKNGTFVKVISGEANVGGVHLREKDEIGMEDVERIIINPIQRSEIMIFELPMKKNVDNAKT